MSVGAGYALLRSGVSSGPVTPAYVSSVLSVNSLVGYWRATDTVGSATLTDTKSGLTATISGGVTLGSTALLSGQSSALFDGSSGFAQLGAAGGTAFNWEYTQPWAFEFLINPNSPRSGTINQMVWTKVGISSPWPGMQIGLQFNGGVVAGNVVWVLLQGAVGGDGIQVYGSTDLTNGSVWHVAVSYDGSGTAAGIKIYVNSIPETPAVLSDTLAGTSILNTTNPCIGAWGNGSQFFYKGNIEELAIYNAAIGATTSTLIASNVLDAGKPAYHYGLSLGRAPLAAISVPNLIVDTDISSDIGDVGALALACILHKRSECNLVGAITNSNDARSADAAYSIAHYLLGSAAAFVGAYQGAITNAGAASLYTGDISTTFGQNLNRTSYTDGTQKYRALLMAQPNNSVVIASIGFLSNLDALLTSAANAGGDGFGTGAAIIAQKVKRIVCMSGRYPTGTAEFNLAGVPAASSDFFANCPVEIVVTGAEIGDTTAGGPASVVSSATSPIQQAWHDWNVATSQTTRPLWDEIAILTAVRGVNSTSGIVPAGLRGTDTVNATNGNNAWTNTAGNVTYTRKSAADAAFTSLITSMYAALPNAF